MDLIIVVTCVYLFQPESDAKDSFEGVSNPRAELPVNNAKYVRMCTEMYLGRKDICFLGNFEGFDNLTDLWINDNEVGGWRSIYIQY